MLQLRKLILFEIFNIHIIFKIFLRILINMFFLNCFFFVFEFIFHLTNN